MAAPARSALDPIRRAVSDDAFTFQDASNPTIRLPSEKILLEKLGAVTQDSYLSQTLVDTLKKSAGEDLTPQRLISILKDGFDIYSTDDNNHSPILGAGGFIKDCIRALIDNDSVFLQKTLFLLKSSSSRDLYKSTSL